MRDFTNYSGGIAPGGCRLGGYIKRDTEAAQATIIGGDFNTDDPNSPAALSPGERSFPLLRDKGFCWAFDGITHKDRITCPAKGRYPPASFDHFWTRGLGKPLASVQKTEGSDHLPVVLQTSL